MFILKTHVYIYLIESTTTKENIEKNRYKTTDYKTRKVIFKRNLFSRFSLHSSYSRLASNFHLLNWSHTFHITFLMFILVLSLTLSYPCICAIINFMKVYCGITFHWLNIINIDVAINFYNYIFYFVMVIRKNYT